MHQVTHHGEDPDDHHVHCLDIVSLEPRYHHHASHHCDFLCRVPVDGGHGKAISPSVELCPGVRVLDLWDKSEKVEMWKDGSAFNCLVPEKLIGWEFYSCLWPAPEGTGPLTLGEHQNAVQLLVGRTPGGRICPSILFMFVPQGHSYSNLEGSSAGGSLWPKQPTTSRGQAPPRDENSFVRATAGKLEMSCCNICKSGTTILPRLTVASPDETYSAKSILPSEPNWGLFVSPRSRSLVLLNKQGHRIDIQLAMMLAVDAVFYGMQKLVDTMSRLFEAFGTQELMPKLFGDMDPFKFNNGMTSSVVAEHLTTTSDGRLDYLHLFDARMPAFFVSNSSANLCYMTPQEAKAARKLAPGSHNFHLDAGGPKPLSMPDIPCWTLQGRFGKEGRKALQVYRATVPLRSVQEEIKKSGDWLSILGMPQISSWLTVNCADVKQGQSAAIVQSMPAGRGQTPSDVSTYAPSAPSTLGPSSPTLPSARVAWQDDARSRDVPPTFGPNTYGGGGLGSGSGPGGPAANFQHR